MKVLVVDDEAPVRSVLGRLLRAQGFEVVEAEDACAAVEWLRKGAASAVVLDLKMPGLGGMEALATIKELCPEVPVIILTAHGDIPIAVEAMRQGAYDFLTKPFNSDAIVFAVRRAVERGELGAQMEQLRDQLHEGSGSLRELMGASPQIQKVIDQIQRVAPSNFTVLIQGETGTGKEIVARAIHEHSARYGKSFIALDCGAIPETLIESELFGYEKGAFTGADRRKEGHFQFAQRGSLFLDEIANLPPTTQSKLLRVLQERRVQPLGSKRTIPVDVRIIAASNVPLAMEMRAGRFRQDLYYRLSEFTIALPPLRDRPEDILHLAARFLTEASMELKRPVHGISEEAADLLLRYDWPGNVRELRNIIRQAALSGSGLVTPEQFGTLDAGAAPVPPAGKLIQESAHISLKEARDKGAAEAERQAICWAVQAARGNKSEAARLLRTDYKTLYRKLKRYDIRTGDSFPS